MHRIVYNILIFIRHFLNIAVYMLYLQELTETQIRNLLCAIKQLAAHMDVDLQEKTRGQEDVMNIPYSNPATMKIWWSDAIGFIAVNTFEADFLSFFEEFFDKYADHADL